MSWLRNCVPRCPLAWSLAALVGLFAGGVPARAERVVAGSEYRVTLGFENPGEDEAIERVSLDVQESPSWIDIAKVSADGGGALPPGAERRFTVSFVVASNAPDGATGEILLLLRAPEDTFVDRTEYRLKLVVGREDEGAEANRGEQEPEAIGTRASDALLPTIAQLESICAAASRHVEAVGAAAADILSAAAEIAVAKEGVQLPAAVGEAQASCGQLDAVKVGVVTSAAQVRSEVASAQSSASAATASLASCESSADLAAAQAAEGHARSAARRAVASYGRAQEGDDLFDRITAAASAALAEVHNARDQLGAISISLATPSSQLDNAGRSRELAEAGFRECRERQQSVRQQWVAAGGGSDAALAALGKRIEAVSVEPPDSSWLDKLAPEVDAIHQTLDADEAAINDALVELTRCADAGSAYAAVLDASEAMLGLDGVLAELDGLAALGESCGDRLEPGEDDTSRLPELVTVPDLTGQSKDLARAWIEELGLRAFLRPGRCRADPCEPGEVTSVSPEAGSQLERGELVTLVYYKDQVPAAPRRPTRIDCSPWPGTRPVWDETGRNWKCECPGEERWTGSACSSPTEISRTANATVPEVSQEFCDQRWSGTVLSRNPRTGAPACDCPSGEAWSKPQKRCLALPGGGGDGRIGTPTGADCSRWPGTIRDPRTGECRCSAGTWNPARRSCVRPDPKVPAAPPGDSNLCPSNYHSIRRAVAQGDLTGAQLLANMARQQGCDSAKVAEALGTGGGPGDATPGEGEGSEEGECKCPDGYVLLSFQQSCYKIGEPDAPREECEW